jgi:hypothetical protein
MEKDYLLLKRAVLNRPSGDWNDDDYDVLADGVVVGRIFKANAAPVWQLDVDARLRASRRPHANARLCRDARGRDGGVRQELAAGITPIRDADGNPTPEWLNDPTISEVPSSPLVHRVLRRLADSWSVEDRADYQW